MLFWNGKELLGSRLLYSEESHLVHRGSLYSDRGVKRLTLDADSSPWNEVVSIVDEDGFFCHYPEELHFEDQKMN